MRSRRGGSAAAVLLLAACGAEAGPAPHLQAMVARPLDDSTTDTARFESDAIAQRCIGGRGVLISGTRAGNGALVWLRPGDSALAGDYAVLPLGDEAAARGAIVVVRFMLSDVARGVALDSGHVTASEADGRFGVRAAGSGAAIPGATRVMAEARFTHIPPASDSATCAVQA